MRFTIWGEVGAQGIDGPVVLSGRLRLLLAALLVGRNAEVSRNDLISIVWGEGSEPANAEASLRQYVSRLRRALAASESDADQLITTTPAGYRLDVDRSWVDGDVLADAVNSGVRPEDLVPMTPGEPYGSYCEEWWCLAEVEQQRQLAREASTLPPALSQEPVRGPLPQATTSFVGRAQDVAAVATAVSEHRLVTLTGFGGVGKTRLAHEVARRLEGGFPGGVWLIELDAVGDPAEVLGAVATVLNVKQAPEASLTDCIASTLADRRCLVLLDNCEHVLDAAADLVQAVLGRGSGPSIIATSREALRVAGEHVWRVRSLAAAEGMDSAAAELLVDRARAVDHTFAVSSKQDATAVAEICQRLDGLPLAIELAAARMVALTPVEVRDRLDDRFRLLASGRREVERHQTLGHALQWSIDLLSPDEVGILERCSVFAATFDLEAANKIAGSGKFDEYHLLDHLESLVRKSLIVVDRSLERGPITSFRLLETVRAYGRERLRQSGDLERVSQRHASYYLTRVKEARQAFEGHDNTLGRHLFEVSWASIRATFAWLNQRGKIEQANVLLEDCFMYCWTTSAHEHARWARELAQRPDCPPKTIGIAAMWAMIAGDYRTAVSLACDGLSRCNDMTLDPDPYCLFGQAIARYSEGDWTSSFPILRELEEAASSVSSFFHAYAAAILHGVLKGAELQGVVRPQVSAELRTRNGIEAIDRARSIAVDLGNPALDCYVQLFRSWDSAVPDEQLSSLRTVAISAERCQNWSMHELALSELVAVASRLGDVEAFTLLKEVLPALYDQTDSRALYNALMTAANLFDSVDRAEMASTVIGFLESRGVHLNFKPRDDTETTFLARRAWVDGSTLPTDELLSRVLDEINEH